VKFVIPSLTVLATVKHLLALTTLHQVPGGCVALVAMVDIVDTLDIFPNHICAIHDKQLWHLLTS
jgi:hypothetical protein